MKLSKTQREKKNTSVKNTSSKKLKRCTKSIVFVQRFNFLLEVFFTEVFFLEQPFVLLLHSSYV